MRLFDILRDRLHAKAGIIDKQSHGAERIPLSELEQTEWSPAFEKLMRQRMIMGAMRYARLERKRLMHQKYDLLTPIQKKIKLYKETGNTEYLVDIANYCLIAFEYDDHPKKHFKALDDHHDHCQFKK